MAANKMAAKKKKTSSSKSKANNLVENNITQDNQNINSFEDNYLISWKAPEFIFHKKSLAWHASIIIFNVMIITILALMKQWLSIPVFLLLGFLLFKYAEVKPRMIEIGISNIGVKVGDNFYPYNRLKSFWLVYEPPIKTLNFETTKRFTSLISIQLEDADPFLIKSILKDHILEELERTEDFIGKIARLLKF